MNFSLFYFAAEDDQCAEFGKYDLLLEGSRFADCNGFSAVWLPERHFNAFGGRFPNPAVAAAAVAIATRTVAIRSGSVVLPLHDPVQVAEDWAMVDHLSSGRVELGIASGWVCNDFVLARDNWENRHSITRHKLDEIKRLWRGESLARPNGAGEVVEFRTYPRPVQTELTVWVAAGGSEETFRFAGSIGAKIVTNMIFQTSETLEQNVAAYYDALEQAGHARATGEVALMVHTFVGGDHEEALAAIKPPLKRYLANFTNLLDTAQSAATSGKTRDFLVEMACQRFMSRNGIFGSIESASARVREFARMGITEVACLIDFGIDSNIVLEHLPYLKALKDELENCNTSPVSRLELEVAE